MKYPQNLLITNLRIHMRKTNFDSQVILDDAADIGLEYLNFFKKLKNGNILITGGGGFLLSYFIEIVHILNINYNFKINLHIYDLFKNGLDDRLLNYKKDKHIKFYKKDVSKKFEIKDTYDLIIHGATIASPTFYKKYPIETIKVNTLGYINILDQIINHKKLKNFIYMSSSEIYGDPPNDMVPTSEDYNGNVSIVGSRACYDESKRIGETISVNYYNSFKLPIKIIRPFNVYGPGQSLKDARFMPDVISNIKSSKDIFMYSNGKPTRSFCYIADQIRGILEVLAYGKNGQSYNVGNTFEISMLEAAKKIKNIANKNLKIIFKKNKQKNYNQDSPNRRCPNIKKLKKLNGWSPKYNFENGVSRTLKFYKIIN